jgi:hypothetical protein
MLVFKTVFRKHFTNIKQVICLDHQALFKPLITSEYGSYILEMFYSYLKPAIADLSYMLWHSLKYDYQILVLGSI